MRQWNEHFGQVRTGLLLAAILIAVASLVVSHILTRDLEQEERNKMEVWAEAMRSLNTADENTDLNLVLKVINENNTIPVIVLDSKQHVQTYRNIKFKSNKDNFKKMSVLAKQLLKQGHNIRIQLGDSLKSDFIDVCYDDSVMLKRLEIYPFIQLGVVLIFVFIAIFALLSSKRAEQNKVWVGLSKETAHQLGTPISSLMAWTEILKENYPNDKLIPELNKDVERLQMITARFSKIGSLPEVVPTSLNDVLNNVVDYMRLRISPKVKIVTQIPVNDIIINLNASLFEWVIENLFKNAVDAIGGGYGVITLCIEEIETKVMIDISDTGKGIKKRNIKSVFRPGVTTKKRGWGLGLCLAKRIVEEYHKGKIFVKISEVGKGTTFRIELKK